MKFPVRQGILCLVAGGLLGGLALSLRASSADERDRDQAASRSETQAIQSSAERMSQLVEELSDEKYEGRLPGTTGDALSLKFIIEQFKGLGLQAAGDLNEGYVQRFKTTITEPGGDEDGNPANPLLGTAMASSNVIGILPGNDSELSKEVILISAHRDHLGCTPKREQYPGANDDLSGLASIMELARKFAQHKGENKRTLMFVAYGAEEQKEMGSMHHIATLLPDSSHKSIVLMISIDMIGLGYDAWSGFGQDKRKRYAEQWYADVYNDRQGDSDEYSHEYVFKGEDTFSYDAGPFAKHGVNNRVFGKTKGIPNYHQPGDTWDTLHFEPAAIVTDTIFDFLWKVSQDPTARAPADSRTAALPRKPVRPKQSSVSRTVNCMGEEVAAR